MSPEELKDIKFAKLESSKDFQLSESFSVGLTCLDAAILSSSSSLYQKDHKFNYEELARQLNELKEVGYSQILTILIFSLCEVNEDNRSTCSELYDWLLIYKNSIMNLEQFEVDRIPSKIALQIHAKMPEIYRSQSFANQRTPQVEGLAPQNGKILIKEKLDSSTPK